MFKKKFDVIRKQNLNTKQNTGESFHFRHDASSPEGQSIPLKRQKSMEGHLHTAPSGLAWEGKTDGVNTETKVDFQAKTKKARSEQFQTMDLEKPSTQNLLEAGGMGPFWGLLHSAPPPSFPSLHSGRGGLAIRGGTQD